MMEGSGSVQIMSNPDPGGRQTSGSYGSGSTLLACQLAYCALSGRNGTDQCCAAVTIFYSSGSDF